MSGDAKPLDESFDDAADGGRHRASDVEQELRFHLAMLVDDLCAEGYERADAEAEARRRFGDLDALTEECTAVRGGPLGAALHALLSSKVVAGVVLAVTVFLAVSIGDPPYVLLTVLMPVSWAAGACALLAAVTPSWRGVALRAGRRSLGLLFALALLTFVLGGGDWVHSVWSVRYPLTGLLFGSGVLLVDVWPDDRHKSAGRAGRWNGAVVACAGVLILSTLPFVLRLTEPGSRSLGPDDPSLLAALYEQASVGLLGEPIGGAPRRMVTTAMASTWFGAVHWGLFVSIALASRLVRQRERRQRFLLVAPMLLSVTLLPFLADGNVHYGIWDHSRLFVLGYGPALLGALAAGLFLFAALRRASRRERARLAE